MVDKFHNEKALCTLQNKSTDKTSTGMASGVHTNLFLSN